MIYVLFLLYLEHMKRNREKREPPNEILLYIYLYKNSYKTGHMPLCILQHINDYMYLHIGFGMILYMLYWVNQRRMT